MVHRLAPEGFRRVEARMVWFRLFMVSVLVAVGWYAVLGEVAATNLWVAIAAGTIMCVVAGKGMRNGVVNQRRAWMSYELTLDEDRIMRRMDGYDDMVIGRDEVTQIREMSGNGLTVIAAAPRRMLWIDRSLEGYEQVKQELAQWRPIEVKAPLMAGRVLVTLAAVVLAVAAMGVAYSTNQLRWYMPTAVPLMVLLVWCFLRIRRDPHVDARTRRAIWIVVLPLFSLAGKLVMLLAR